VSALGGIHVLNDEEIGESVLIGRHKTPNNVTQNNQ